MSNMIFGGQWTDEKLGILRRYLDAYTTALKNQPFNLIYVDAFAGGGSWTPRAEYSSEDYEDFQNLHKGSSRIALEIQDKPFDRLVFVDTNPQNIFSLQILQSQFPNRNIEITRSDANTALPTFCGKLTNFDRAVVFLDPYATEVDWHTIEAIAKTQKIDCWILFPLMAIARMLPTSNEPTEALANRLDRIFGDRKHWQGLYSPSPQRSLFGDEPGRNGRMVVEKLRIFTGRGLNPYSHELHLPEEYFGTQRTLPCSSCSSARVTPSEPLLPYESPTPY